MTNLEIAAELLKRKLAEKQKDFSGIKNWGRPISEKAGAFLTGLSDIPATIGELPLEKSAANPSLGSYLDWVGANAKMGINNKAKEEFRKANDNPQIKRFDKFNINF